MTFSAMSIKFLMTKNLIISLIDIILYVWSQYDGANIEQWTIGYGWRQNQN